MFRSSSLGIVFVTGVLVVSGSRQPDRVPPEEGYQNALSKLRQGALDAGTGAGSRGHFAPAR